MEQLSIRMKNIARLMREGVTFTRAVTPSPLCAPARACLAAGLRYERCRVPGNQTDYPLDQKTFYSVLRQAGYRVAGCGKFDLHKPTHSWGLDGWIDELATMGFTEGIDNAGKWDAVNSGREEPQDPYMSYLHEHGLARVHLEDMARRRKDRLAAHATALPEEAYCDNWLTLNGLRLLRGFPRGRPWFLQVNFTGPHEPWDVTARMKTAWRSASFPLPAGWQEGNEDRITDVRRNYAAMLENIDRNAGLLIDEVRKRGELENTYIIYSSDHGEMLGDFGCFGKSRPERGSAHIPLVIWGPGVQRGHVRDCLVELQDIARTILELAEGGAHTSGSLAMTEALDSVSLVPDLIGESTARRRWQLSALGGWRMVSDGKHKLIEENGKPNRLYDLREDPWELSNIAPHNADVVSALQAL
jgi:arylsulfatase A-like enzyme